MHYEVLGMGYLSLTSLNGNDLVSHRTGVVFPACACNHEAGEGVIWQGGGEDQPLGRVTL